MKKILLFLLILFIPFFINAKEIELNNVITRGKNSGDVKKVIKTNDGNYMITSLQRTKLPEDGGVAILEKYDPNGNLIWENVYGVSIDVSMVDFSSMVVTKDDSIIVVGHFGETDDIGIEGKGLYDGLIIKFDKNGNLLWKKGWGGSNYDYFKEVVLDHEENIYIYGNYQSNDIDNIENKGKIDTILMKYDQDGNKLWEKTIGQSGEECIEKIMVDQENNLIVNLSTTSKEINNIALNGERNIITLKYEPDGNIVWQKNIGADKNAIFYDSFITKDNDYLLVTSVQNTEFDDITIQGMKDLLVVKYDKNGNILWKKTWGGSKMEITLQTMLLENDELVIIGTTQSQDIEGLENDLTSVNFILRYNKDGEIIYQKNLGIWMLTTYTIGLVEDYIVVSGYTLNSEFEINGEKLGNEYVYIAIDKKGNIKVDKPVLGNGTIRMKSFMQDDDKIIVLGYSEATEIPGFTETISSTNRYWLEYTFLYDLKIKETINGKPSVLQQGTKGIINPTPENGYKVDKVIVKDTQGNEIETKLEQDGTYSFDLYDDVTVEVLFALAVDNPKTGILNYGFIVVLFMIIPILGMLCISRYNQKYGL